MQRVATSLGVSASLLSLSGAAGAASAAGVASVAGIGAAALAKSLLVGVGAGMVVSGALFTVSVVSEPSRAPGAPPKVPAVAAPTQRPPYEAISPPARALPAPIATTEANVASERRTSAVSAAPRAFEPPTPAEISEVPAAGTPASIAEEVAELDRARTLLVAGKANDALHVLDAYGSRWPSGVMALEAMVVRVEVELARGNRASAERHAQALIAAFPNTGHARKVASLLERANEK
jgi:hypothetical protein